MAINIYKYTEYVPWDAEGVGVTRHGGTSGGCDLSNYYTIDQMRGYAQAPIHYSNIIYDGLFMSNAIYGVAVVTGWLGTSTPGRLRGNSYGVAVVTGILGVVETLMEHDLTSSYHTESGLTTGHFLKATGANTFAWQAHGLTASDVGAASVVHNHDSDYISIVTSPTVGNFPTLTSAGELENSVYNASSFATSDHDHDSDYMSIIIGATPGNLASFDSGGELQDSGYAISDFSVSTHNHDTDYISIVSAPIVGNITTLTAGGEIQDSGYAISDFSASTHNHDTDYISIVGTPTEGNFPTLTSGGELIDSIYGPSSFATATHDHDTVYEPIISKSAGYLTWTGTALSWVDETYSLSTHNHDTDYISIVTTPTEGNFPTLTLGGELVNSAYNSSSFATSDHTHTGLVDAYGTPADNQIAVWVDSNTIEGTSALTWNGSGLSVNGTVTSSGDMTSSNFCLSSDRRLKDKIEDYEPRQLDVKYRQFEMKSEPGQIRYGVVAQELIKTHPEFIRVDHTAKDFLTVSYIDLMIAEIAYLKDEVKELRRLLTEKNGTN